MHVFGEGGEQTVKASPGMFMSKRTAAKDYLLVLRHVITPFLLADTYILDFW